MKRRTILFSFIAVLLLSIGLIAQQGRGAGRGPGLDRMLDLSEEQQTKIDDLRLLHQKEMLPLRTQVESLRAELQLEMTAETFDKNKAEKIVSEMQKIRTEMQMSRVLHHQAIRETLTAEQRKKFDLHTLSGKGFHGRRGPHQGAGYGRGQGGQAWAEPEPPEN